MSNTPNRNSTPLYQADMVTATVRLLVGADNVTELRVLDATTKTNRWLHTASGYFGDPDKLAEALRGVKTAKGIYITPNPVDPSLLARAANRIRKTPKGESTQDTNILRRRWLLIDTNPQRASGISATDAEHEAALERARSIFAYLRDCGWVAVGTALLGGPPRRSVREELPHTAPPSGNNGRESEKTRTPYLPYTSQPVRPAVLAQCPWRGPLVRVSLG